MIAAQKAGRPRISPAQRWLDAMQTTAWYHFIRDSGINYKTIRIKFARIRPSHDTSSVKHYGDRDRQWHRWSHGIGPVKPAVLQIVEQKVPGSMAVYQDGPDGSRLWHTLAADSHLQAELRRYSQPALTSVGLLLDSDELMASVWHRITFRILTYRIRKEVALQPVLPGESKQLTEAARQSLAVARQALLALLEIEQASLGGFGLYRQDLLYLLDQGLIKPVARGVKFSERLGHPGWRECVVGGIFRKSS